MIIYLQKTFQLNSGTTWGAGIAQSV